MNLEFYLIRIIILIFTFLHIEDIICYFYLQLVWFKKYEIEEQPSLHQIQEMQSQATWFA